MNGRHQKFETFRREQMNYITTGNPIRATDLINRSDGIPPPLISKMLNMLPTRWSGKLLANIAERARKTTYLLTYSTLLINRPSSTSYYETERIRHATGDSHRSIVQMLLSSEAEVELGPMERPELFANAINRAVIGDPSSPTCNQCRHYRRSHDQQRGNAGHCQYQDLILGNYDHCTSISTITPDQKSSR